MGKKKTAQRLSWAALIYPVIRVDLSTKADKTPRFVYVLEFCYFDPFIRAPRSQLHYFINRNYSEPFANFFDLKLQI